MRDSPDMSESKPFASLKPTLLARKGGAKPAMRPQLHPIHQLKETAPFAFEDDDLGWNDHGEADQEELHPAVQAALSDASADVLPLKSGPAAAACILLVHLAVQLVDDSGKGPAVNAQNYACHLVVHPL